MGRQSQSAVGRLTSVVVFEHSDRGTAFWRATSARHGGCSGGPRAKTVEELELWKRATSFWQCANSLLDRPEFDRDWKLRNQLRDAMDSVLSNIAEGFEQATDRGFAKYLFVAKASTAEARKRLWIAAERAFIGGEEYQQANALGDEVARMSVGLIKYLLRSDRRDRGLGPPRGNGGSPNRQRRLSPPQEHDETQRDEC